MNHVKSHSNTKKVVYYIQDNILMLLFLVIMLIAVAMVKVSQSNHPLVCSSKTTVQEILSLNEHYAQLKLTNGQIINYQISEQQKGNDILISADPPIYLSGADKTVYNKTVKPNDEICLEYVRK